MLCCKFDRALELVWGTNVLEWDIKFTGFYDFRVSIWSYLINCQPISKLWSEIAKLLFEIWVMKTIDFWNNSNINGVKTLILTIQPWWPFMYSIGRTTEHYGNYIRALCCMEVIEKEAEMNWIAYCQSRSQEITF